MFPEQLGEVTGVWDADELCDLVDPIAGILSGGDCRALELGRVTVQGTGRELLGNDDIRKAYLGM